MSVLAWSMVGIALAGLSLPEDNPPSVRHAIWALPGALAGLGACWAMGSRRHAATRERAEEAWT